MNIKKIAVTFATASIMLSGALLPKLAFAAKLSNPFQEAQNKLTTAGGEAGVQNSGTLPEIVGRIINIALSLLGIIFLVLGVYAGFRWMTARGEKGDVEEAQKTLTNAVIGLVIVIAAYAISNFVIGEFFAATQ